MSMAVDAAGTLSGDPNSGELPETAGEQDEADTRIQR
jgi:hypothetical protein